ncbi:MAG: protein translocase subunit SecF, partial [Proteobacteria bacterium]|nr:protein translocase subunit SecF [Pseudomonadota bacterium]
MQLLNKKTHIDFLSLRKLALVLSVVLMLISIAALATRSLNFGIDFTGGTLVEVGYSEAVEVDTVRKALNEAGINDAIVQHFGTAKDVMIRLPVAERENAAGISGEIMQTLRKDSGETLAANIEGLDTVQQCISQGQTTACKVQMRRVEFVGPQVGDELANQGGLAMIYALIGILIYVTFRFKWQFSIGSVVALVHDVLITLGAFAVFQFDFSLSVLAAVLAVIGYSLNDTIVVFDRIRENFRKMRKGDRFDVINAAINDTLPRTILTSLTTLFVVLTLFFFGGEALHGFSIALLIGVIVGTYSSIFIASPSVLALGIQREDLLEPEKNG